MKKQKLAFFDGGEKAKTAEIIEGATLTPEAERLLSSFEVLAAAPDGVKKLREMILGLALHGRLVAQDPQDETASTLLRSIATVRGPRKATVEDESAAPPLLSSNEFSTLPQSWQWAPTNSIADRMLGKMLDNAKHTKGRARPYLRNINVRWAAFDTTNLLTMFFEDDEFERYGVKVGDVLICEGGEPGRAAVWTDASTTMFIQKAIHRARLHGGILPQWLVLNLRYDTWTNRLASYFTGATIKHFTGRALASYPIRLAHVAEQARIVAKVDHLMALCDTLEAKLRAADEGARRLAESLVAELLA